MRSVENLDIWREELGVEPPRWILDAIAMNPAYCMWGPREDYMWKEGEGWESRVILATWKEFAFPLNDLNECVNFYFHTEQNQILSLTLWWIHPRKGASRGIEIASIAQEEIPAVLAFLKQAAERNAARFARVVEAAP